jgi:hypothetical protein
LENIAKQIAEITSDYHKDDNFVMDSQHIINWVVQFDENDREFILSELLHILKKGVYVSKDNAKKILFEFIKFLYKHLKYTDINQFLGESVFISTQKPHKSQSILLTILDEILKENSNYIVKTSGSILKKNYIYIDDILGTGQTYKREVKKYIEDNNLINDLVKDKIQFISFFFCIHTWALNNTKYSLKIEFKGEDLFLNPKKFQVISHYNINNNSKDYNSSYNLIYPEKSKPEYDAYLSSLENAQYNLDRAYRDLNKPNQELFFSSKNNRVRLEQIFLDKGIQIINSINDEDSRKKHRPLGRTYPSYKTFGTGTLFFTWSNISNTCPIVFWWDNPAHNWKGLFPLKNRGN